MICMPHLMGTKSAAGHQIGSDARGLGPGRGHPRVMKGLQSGHRPDTGFSVHEYLHSVGKGHVFSM